MRRRMMVVVAAVIAAGVARAAEPIRILVAGQVFRILQHLQIRGRRGGSRQIHDY